MWATVSGVPEQEAYEGDYAFTEDGYGSGASYNWTFTGLPSEIGYEVYATWNPQAEAGNPLGPVTWTDNATYTVYGDSYAVLDTTTVDQNDAPVGLGEEYPWQTLANVPPGTIQGGTIEVTLTNNTSDYAYVDAVMLRPLWPELNLSTDSNNSGGNPDPNIGDPDDLADMASPGKIVGANDDTLAPLAVDFIMNGYVPDGNDLLELTCTGDGSIVEVYDAPTGGTQILSGKTWSSLGSLSLPVDLYVKGLDGGTSTFSLSLLNGPGVRPLADEVKVRVVEVDDYMVEVEEWDGSWTELGEDEGFWDTYNLRWTATGIPADVVDYVTAIEWWAQPWSEIGNDPPYQWMPGEYEVFANGSQALPVISKLVGGALADWVVTPAVQFAGGAVTTLLAAHWRGSRKIVEIDWKGYDPGDDETNFEENGHPAKYGGGDRLFVESNNPAGRTLSGSPIDQVHDTIRVNVKIDRPVTRGTFNCQLRWMDPDHYSDDNTFDIKGVDAKDNEGLGAYFVQWKETPQTWMRYPANSKMYRDLQGSIIFKAADGDEKDSTALRIQTRTPTDNFIVVAGYRYKDLPNVKLAADGKTPVLPPSGGGNPVKLPDGHMTPILTVWRTLYTERDHMDDPMFEQSPVPSKISAGFVVPLSIAGSSFRIDHAIASQADNQFKGGKITLFDVHDGNLGTFDVVGNTTGAEPTITINGDPSNAGSFVNLVDDDIAHGVTAQEMAIDPLLWASVFEPACILVNSTRNDLLPQDATDVQPLAVSFKINIGTDGQLSTTNEEFKAVATEAKQTLAERNFWVVWQVGAFQGSVTEDGDPDITEPSQLGLTRHLVGPSEFTGSMVFRETVEDRYEQLSWGGVVDDHLQITSAHELAHHFGVGDAGYGSLMDGWQHSLNASADKNKKVLNGKALRKVILRDIPC